MRPESHAVPTALEYLKQVQAEAFATSGLSKDPRRGDSGAVVKAILKDRVLKRRLRKLHGSNQDVSGLFKDPHGRATDHLEWIGEQLLAFIGSKERGLLEGVPVGELPTRDFNAAAIRSPSGVPIVVLDVGTTALIHNVTKSVTMSLPTPMSAPEWPVSEAAAVSLQWIAAFAFGEAVFGLTLPPHPRDPMRISAIGTIGDLARAFILGHEFGHVMRGHLDNARVSTLTFSAGPSASVVARFDVPHELEFEADEVGADLAWQFCRRHVPGEGQLTWFAIALVLDILATFELLGGVATMSHPPARDRRARFEANFSQHFDEEIKLEIEYVDAFFAEIARMHSRLPPDMQRGGFDAPSGPGA